MDANISAACYIPGMSFENRSPVPPYPYPHLLHNQHPYPHHPPQPIPFNAPNTQRFDANWPAGIPPPPPPPPLIPFTQVGPHPPFDSAGHPLFPQIPFMPQNTQTPPQNATVYPESSQERVSTPSKEHAKDAILAMVRAEITYNDLIAEGIKAPLLNALFTELNLPLPKPSTEPAEPAEPLDPAMERKDRIAKLLAAKKNQSAAASPKESAQPIERVSTPELISRKETPLPVPVKHVPREENKIDFSIPGLFMTSAEQEEMMPSLPSTTDIEIAKVENDRAIVGEVSQAAAEQNLTDSIVEEQQSGQLVETVSVPVRQPTPTRESVILESNPLKRGPEPFSANIMPQPKRQVSMSQDITPASDSDKAIDSTLNTGRSKVNQNILKDRMAALKADLLLKNSRKKALQDGMPVLNAEVQKTRERLQDNEVRLRSIRAEIEDKSAELSRLREEESQLHDEVQRLKNQLADGETGQQQFSKELTQLNDQIMADENESRVSQTSNLLSSPVSGRTGTSTQTHLAKSNAYSSEPVPFTEIVSEPSLSYEHDNNIQQQEPSTSQIATDHRQTETEYSPEQDDLDRQLNDEVAYTASQAQPTSGDTVSLLPIPHETAPQSFSIEVTPSGVESERDSDDDRMSIDEADEVQSVGSASMSDSGSDEYEPPVHLDPTNEPDEDDADDYEPQEAQLISPESSDHADNDDYEPAEEVSVLNVDALEELRQNEEEQASSTTHYLANNTTMDSQVPLTEAATLPSPQPSEKQLTLVSTAEVTTQEHPTVTLIEPLSNSAQSVPVVPQFVPYSSPLSNMKQFRFNPQFNDVVKEGYRSLTYSHQIDKDIPLCPTELSGTVCVDGDCEEQHFSRFALSGTSNHPKAG